MRTVSPGASRSTSTACRPSAPSTSSSSVSGTASRRNSGAPSSSGTAGSEAVTASPPVERVAHPGEQPALRLAVRLGLVLAAQGGQLPQQLLLLGVEPGGSGHLDVDDQVAPTGPPQPRRAVGPQRQDAAGLGAGADVEVLL